MLGRNRAARRRTQGAKGEVPKLPFPKVRTGRRLNSPDPAKRNRSPPRAAKLATSLRSAAGLAGALAPVANQDNRLELERREGPDAAPKLAGIVHHLAPQSRQRP
jgi:hypothetical protein